MSNYIGKIESEDLDESKQWTQSIDRGGLITIDDTLFQFLVSVELEIKNHFNIGNATSQESLKDIAFQAVLANEDVLFFWDMVAVNWDIAESQELLKIIIEH